MFTKPRIAFVGRPFELRRGGMAKNARYKVFAASTITSREAGALGAAGGAFVTSGAARYAAPLVGSSCDAQRVDRADVEP
jgi:hypothetical protein